MSLNRREILRLGAVGATGMMLSSAASPVTLPALVYRTPPPAQPHPGLAAAPAGIDPRLFERAKASLDTHRNQIPYRNRIGIVDFSRASGAPRFYVVDLVSGHVDNYLVTHGRGSDPAHSGYLERFSNQPGSNATSNGAYATGDFYHGKYGLSMRLAGLDWSNNNAMARAIVLHNAWYAEPGVVAQHGKLGRSEGCFAFSRKSQYEVMDKLPPGHLIFADRIA